jgi:hypothetical protein
MQTQTVAGTEQRRSAEEKIQQLRDLFADAPVQRLKRSEAATLSTYLILRQLQTLSKKPQAGAQKLKRKRPKLLMRSITRPARGSARYRSLLRKCSDSNPGTSST